MAGQRQEHVVQVGALDGDPGDRIVIDPVQQPTQGGDPVVGHPQREQLGVGGRLGEYGGHLGQPSRVGELHLHSTTRHPALQLGRCPLGDDPATVQDAHPMGEFVGLLEVLRGQQHGHAVGDQLPHDLPHLPPAAWVQPRGRLVEEDQPRRADQRHREVQAALHPTGVRLGPAARRISELEPLQQVVDDGLDAAAVEVVQVGHQQQVLPAGVELVDRRELSGHADGSAYLIRLAPDVVPGDADLPGVGREQCGDDVDHRGLAGAVGPEECVDTPLRDLEVDALEHFVVAEALVEAGNRYRCVSGHAQHGEGLTQRQGQALFSQVLSARPLRSSVTAECGAVSTESRNTSGRL